MVINGIISLFAIGGLCFMGFTLIEHGIDGTIALVIIAAIAGIAGYNVKEIIAFVKGKGKEG